MPTKTLKKISLKNSYIESNTLNIEEVLLEINQKIMIQDEITFRIKQIDRSPLYYGCFVYFGFKIKNIQKLDNQTILTLIKEKEIPANLTKKRYSILIKLPRTGKNGKRIFVYKLRTMQPYSEYIQDYVIERNGLNEDGTIKNDFRITKTGKFLRKYWLDELPMLINLFKGDVKLIGFRPLSDTMLNTYPKEFVPERNNYKPGLIPPYYIDKPDSFEELIQSEKNYIKKYQKKGFRADVTYFYKFLNAVFIRGSRSS